MNGWSLSWWRRLESCLCSEAWRVCMVHSYVCLLIYTTQSMCLSAWDSYYCVVFSRNDLMMNWPPTPPIMMIYYSTCFYQEKLGTYSRQMSFIWNISWVLSKDKFFAFHWYIGIDPTHLDYYFPTCIIMEKLGHDSWGQLVYFWTFESEMEERVVIRGREMRLKSFS